jgi:hypothetical protein
MKAINKTFCLPPGDAVMAGWRVSAGKVEIL